MQSADRHTVHQPVRWPASPGPVARRSAPRHACGTVRESRALTTTLDRDASRPSRPRTPDVRCGSHRPDRGPHLPGTELDFSTELTEPRLGGSRRRTGSQGDAAERRALTVMRLVAASSAAPMLSTSAAVSFFTHSGVATTNDISAPFWAPQSVRFEAGDGPQ